MDYLEIVLQGYCNENNREHLDKYFLKEFKKAEKEHYKPSAFFNGCLKIVEAFENHLQEQVFERKKDLHLMIDAAKDGTLSHAEQEGKTIEQKRQETIEYCELELKDVRPDGIGGRSFTIHLSSLTKGRIRYNMKYDEVLYIKEAINDAYKQAVPPQ